MSATISANQTTASKKWINPFSIKKQESQIAQTPAPKIKEVPAAPQKAAAVKQEVKGASTAQRAFLAAMESASKTDDVLVTETDDKSVAESALSGDSATSAVEDDSELWSNEIKKKNTCNTCTVKFTFTEEEIKYYSAPDKTFPKNCEKCRTNNRIVTCCEDECSNTFSLSKEEIAFFSKPGMAPPKRCTDCRAARKKEKESKAADAEDTEETDAIEWQCPCATLFTISAEFKSKLDEQGKTAFCHDCRTVNTKTCAHCKKSFFTKANAHEMKLKNFLPPKCCSKICKDEFNKRK